MGPTILANEWHTALMKYKISSDYRGDGAPRRDVTAVMHATPGDEFATTVNREVDRLLASGPQDERVKRYVERVKQNAAEKLYRRLGWMTRAHPYVLDGTRLIALLYSDGLSFSLMAISDDIRHVIYSELSGYSRTHADLPRNSAHETQDQTDRRTVLVCLLRLLLA